MHASIVAIHRCRGHRLPMEPLDRAELAVGGIPGDSHFAPGSVRQLLLMDAEALAALDLRPGAVRENVTVTGVSLMRLAPGTRLELGAAEVEITKACEPCSRMDELRPGLQAELVGRRGMLARVVSPGPVRSGDPVRVRVPAEGPA